MKQEWEFVLPEEIEARSFQIIEEELGGIILPPENAKIIKRVIHTTADFDYARQLFFSPDAVQKAKLALQQGTSIVTDTQMTLSGINKKALAKLGTKAYCFMSDQDVADDAAKAHSTRAAVCMEKASKLNEPLIIAVGNAPTALHRLYKLVKTGKITPALIIGVPVGFVNVVQSKELICSLDVPHIVAKGRKGGSNVAAAICNALLYDISK